MCMASEKIDIEVQDLASDEVLVAQLRTGQVISIVQRDAPELQVLTADGSLIGVIPNSASNQLLLTGSAVIRSLRKQQGLLVHVLLRVTQPQPSALPRQGRAFLVDILFILEVPMRISRADCSERAPLNPA